MSYDYHPAGDLSDDWCLNMSNGYAHVPAEMMGANFADGRVPVAELSLAAVRVMAADCRRWVTPTEQLGPNWMNMGRDLDDVKSYQSRILRILRECVRRGVPLEWS